MLREWKLSGKLMKKKNYLFVYSKIYNYFVFCRNYETEKETNDRLEKQREYHYNMPEEQKQARLDDMREYSQQSRAKESNLRRSTRLEADRANKRIQQALKSTKDREKDAHAKWKQRYKK